MGALAALAAELDAFPCRKPSAARKPEFPDRRPVCVTSGTSFLGAALVRVLLRRGYAVRIAVDSEGDAEKLAEEEREDWSRLEGVVVTDIAEVESLRDAFEGCAAVFHTGGFADPQGISGYTKIIAEMEAVAAENVMEACARTSSVRKCVFTSSLLACVWQRDFPRQVIDERSWSEESLCRDKKLWFALGKTMAEKAAWRRVQGTGIKLATICPGLVVGEDFHLRNPTASIAYLKGGYEMFVGNTLATVDVNKVANAHVVVYEAMTGNSSGRYICFDHILDSTDMVSELERRLRLPRRISGGDDGATREVERHHQHPILSNRKLSTLAFRNTRCFYQMCYPCLD